MSRLGTSLFGLLLLTAAALAQQTSPGAAVELDGSVLFRLHERIGSFTVEERVQAVNARILTLANDTTMPANAIGTVENDVTSDIVAGERILLSLTDHDGAAEGQVRQALARRYCEAIREAVTDYRAEHSRERLARAVLITVAATLALILACWLLGVALRRAFAALGARFGSSRPAHLATTMLGEARWVRMRRRIAQVLWFSGVALLLHFYLLTVASQFPGMRRVERALLDYLTRPLQALATQFSAQVPNLVFVLVVFALAVGLNRLLRVCFDSVEQETVHIPGFYPDWARPTYKLVAVVVFITAAIVAFPYIPGSNSPAFQGISILAGVLFSIGSTSFVGNAFAGVILIYMRSFHIGDRVRIADTVGDVLEKNLLVTRIRTVKNEHITIANSMILGSHVVNFSRAALEDGLILYTSITIGYDAPWRKVHELLMRAAARTNGVSAAPSPFVLQTSLHDSYVEYQINVFTKTPLKMTAIYSELRQNIQDSFNEGGVEILSPAYHAMRDGNHSTIPQNYLGQDYQAPGFRIVKPDAMHGSIE